MAYCNQTLNGITLDCSHSLGGIKTVYIANYGDVESVSADTASGKIVSVTMADSAKFKPYQFRKQTGSMTSTLTVDETAGVNYVSTELSLVFTKMESAKRLELSALSIGQLAVIVEDSNGTFWYLGKDDYVSATSGGGQSGVAKGDGNSYNIVLRDESDTYPFEIDKSAVDSIIQK